MKILEGVTLDLLLDGGLMDNSQYFSVGEGRDNVREHRPVTSYWIGYGCIKNKTETRMVFFKFCVPNELRREDMPGQKYYQGVDKISESKLGLVESLFHFDGWKEGDTIANEFELNELYAKKIMDILDLKISGTKMRFPFSCTSAMIWIELKPLLDQGIITRPNYQMEMLADEK